MTPSSGVPGRRGPVAQRHLSEQAAQSGGRDAPRPRLAGPWVAVLAPPSHAVLLVERDEQCSPQLEKGTRRSWARAPPTSRWRPRVQTNNRCALRSSASSPAGCNDGRSLRRLGAMGKGGGGGGVKGCRPGRRGSGQGGQGCRRRGSCKPLRRRRRTRTLSAAPYTHPQCRVLFLSGW